MVRHAQRLERQAGIAGRAAGAQLGMVNEGFRAGTRPWRHRPHDQIDHHAANDVDGRSLRWLRAFMLHGLFR